MLKVGVDIGARVDEIVNEVIQEYGQRIFNEAMANLGGSVLRSTFRFVVYKNRVHIYSDENLAGWVEFGTGDFAATYLSTATDEMREDAMKFFVNGKGTMPPKKYLYPVYYKYRDIMLAEMDKRIQDFFNTL